MDKFDNDAAMRKLQAETERGFQDLTDEDRIVMNAAVHAHMIADDCTDRRQPRPSRQEMFALIVQESGLPVEKCLAILQHLEEIGLPVFRPPKQ